MKIVNNFKKQEFANSMKSAVFYFKLPLFSVFHWQATIMGPVSTCKPNLMKVKHIYDHIVLYMK
jgi:hypothetical protein